MTLEKLTALGSDGSRVTLWFDDGTKMKVAARVVTDQGLYAGMQLSEDELTALLDTAQRASARDRAVRIVSQTSVSEQELQRRLIRRGERPEDAEDAVDWLRELGAVDDQAMARRIVARCVDRGYGENRIRQELYRKGIPREYWDDVLDDLPDMSEDIRRFVDQKLRGQTPDRKTIQKVAAALQRRGHSWEDIRAALRQYQEELDDGDF